MKNKANRHPVKRLFILGAGASYAASVRRQATDKQAPLDREFCERILRLQKVRPHWVSEARNRIADRWLDHRPLADLGLEDAVLRQLGHLEFIEAMHPRRGRNAITSFEWLNLLTHLICYVLDQARESPKGIYKHFLDKVFPPSQDVQQYRDRIITFNYDVMLDRHLMARVGVEHCYFDRIKSKRGDPNTRNVRFHHPLLVKLHGSVNWRCERDEFEGLLNGTFEQTPHWIGAVWTSNKMPSPEDEIYPLIVPPLPVKPLTTISLFQFLWTKAYEYLHEAEEIIICGYSLPPADRLASSMFANFGNQRLREVTVVDPDPAIISKWQSLLRRQAVAKTQWSYFDDFADYVTRSL